MNNNTTRKIEQIKKIIGCAKRVTLKSNIKIMNAEWECPIITDKTKINVSHAKSLFFSKCDDKGKNDEYNKLREIILANILDDTTYKSFMEDTIEGIYWINLKNQWNDVLIKIYGKPFDSIKIKQKGGRGYNYDFDITFNNKDLFKVEFKSGAKIIEKIPQFFNADANKLFLPGYAEWFYDNYVTKKSPWKDYDPPSKEIYMKEIYKNTSKVDFFNKLYEKEKINRLIYGEKRDKTNKSIAEWLETNYTKLNLEELSKEFIRSQSDKVFVLWDGDTFNIDTLDKDELVVNNIVGIKNNNTILVNSKNSKIQYALLLRWKNHLGVLKPAWQISMKRILA